MLAEAHIQRHEAEAGKLFDRIEKLARAAGVALETALVQSNDVYTQIIAVAKKKKCDLICMMIATHRIWIGVKGSGRPASGAKNMVRIAPIVVESWNRTNFRMLS